MTELKDGPLMKRLMNWIAVPNGTVDTILSSIIIIRLMVGLVFVSEGIQKFLFADSLGVGRFTHIGIPWPEFTAPFVGVVEILGGGLLVLGLFTRLSSIPLLISMTVAVVTTKIPMLAKDGFWKTVHEARTDWAMILGLIFLLAAGAGRWSLDWRRSNE